MPYWKMLKLSKEVKDVVIQYLKYIRQTNGFSLAEELGTMSDLNTQPKDLPTSVASNLSEKDPDFVPGTRQSMTDQNIYDYLFKCFKELNISDVALMHPMTGRLDPYDFHKMFKKNRSYTWVVFTFNTESGATHGHWVTVLVNLKMQQIEYFDSFGAPSNVHDLVHIQLEKLISDARTQFPLSQWQVQNEYTTQHQVGGNECSLYGCWYTLLRLLGVSRNQIHKNRMPNQAVRELEESDKMIQYLKDQWTTHTV